MKYLDNVLLLIIGSGDVIPKLKELIQQNKLEDRVVLTGKVPHEVLRNYTSIADLGVTLDKPTNINYRLSLPNKIFDYIQAGVPVLASDLPEVAKIIRENNVGVIASAFEPQLLAQTIDSALSSSDYFTWKYNTIAAAQKLCWENEEEVLKSVYGNFLK
jgi:glycosyltransferase involved in cell wall biosynthesis